MPKVLWMFIKLFFKESTSWAGLKKIMTRNNIEKNYFLKNKTACSETTKKLCADRTLLNDYMEINGHWKCLGNTSENY